MNNDQSPTVAEPWLAPDQRTEQEILAPYKTQLTTDAQQRKATKAKIVAAVEEISRLTFSLREAITNPAYADTTLVRQAHLLDTMFFTVMKRYADGDYDNEYTGQPDDHALAFAMSVQKQCVETLKALGAINYMKALKPALPPLPLPVPDEQTIKET